MFEFPNLLFGLLFMFYKLTRFLFSINHFLVYFYITFSKANIRELEENNEPN